MDILVSEGLGKDYGHLTAVQGMDLLVPAGEIFGLLGPNGAGKTTFISMVCGALSPSRGTAWICGHDICREPLAARRQVGLVTQEIALYDDITARQNLRFFASLYGLAGRERQEAVDRALAVADLAERSQEPVQRFSGGMKRRLNLAAGLLHRAPLLICDEPTVGVDPQSRAHIFGVLRRLSREESVTIVYTSHYMEEVQALCARVGIMDQGRLVALDTVANLLQEHGQGGLELEAEGEAECLLASLARWNPMRGEGGVILLPAADSVSEVVQAVEASGGKVCSLNRRQSDLEAVFLNLTGHALRDRG